MKGNRILEEFPKFLKTEMNVFFCVVLILLGIISFPKVGLVLAAVLCFFLIIDIFFCPTMKLYQFIVSPEFDVTFRIPQKHIDAKVVYLTIDDVPYRGADSSLPEILDLLEARDAQASLFVIGSWLSDISENTAIKLIKAYGCGTISLQNHGYTDSAHWKMEAKAVKTEIELCKTQCQKALGLSLGDWYRPGCGIVNQTVAKVAKEQKLKIVLGDVYTFDAQIPLALYHFMLLKKKIKNGSIIILHDRPWVLPLLRRLIPWLKGENYKFALLPEQRWYQKWQTQFLSPTLPPSLTSSPTPPKVSTSGGPGVDVETRENVFDKEEVKPTGKKKAE